jgi:hypothetical protein
VWPHPHGSSWYYERMTDADVAHVLELERELQTPECRGNRARFTSLLAEDFLEIGASGQIWNLAATLDLMESEPADAPTIEIHDLTGRVIGDGFILVRWDSRRARRTSLWRRDATSWHLVHHQGTPLPRTSCA